MKKLATLYAALAQALSDVMAYPKHGRLGGLKQDADAVCQAAKLKALPAAQPTANERAAVGLLALALADVLEHPRTPVDLYNTLLDLSCELTSKLHEPGAGPHYEAGHLRWLVSVYAPEAAPSQADLAVENARLRLLLEQASERAADSEPAVQRAPNTDGPHVSEDQLRELCDKLVTYFDGETAPLDGLMLLLWNVTHQSSHLECIDLALRLIAHLYGQTVDSFNQCDKYLQALPSKTYQQTEATPATCAATA